MFRGERVVLRPLQREDVERLTDLYTDLELMARISNAPPLPESLARAEARFEQKLADKDADACSFVIEAEGEAIGALDLYWISHFNATCHLGIGIGRAYWGQRYGQDAVRTAVAYAFRHLNMRKIYLQVLADDARAVGAYRKAGFVEEGRLRDHAWFDGAYRDTLMMAATREEWLRTHPSLSEWS